MTLVSSLSKETAIRFQVLGCLWVYRIHHEVRQQYNQYLYGTASPATSKLIKFPELWRGFRVHQILCQWIAFIALLKYAFPQLLPALIELLVRGPANLSMPAHCYVMGRFIALTGLHRPIVLYLIFASMTFRNVHRFLYKSFDLSLVKFLIQSRESVVEYCQNVESKQYQDCVSGKRVTLLHKFKSRKKSTGLADLESCSQVALFPATEPSDDLWRFHDFMSYRVVKRLDSHIERPDGRTEKATLYYYKLRPNRSVAALQRLRLILARLTTALILVFGFLTICFSAAMVTTALLDWHFSSMYPGCDPQIDSNAKTNGYFSMTLTRYRLMTVAFDLFESANIWIDSGLGVTFVFILPNIIVSDLILYWQSCHPHLLAVLHKAQERFYQNYDANAQQMAPSRAAKARKNLSLRGKMICRAAEMTGKEAELSHSINEISAEMIDFFDQVAKADTVMSYILSFTFILWFLGILVLGSGLVSNYSLGDRVAGLPFALFSAMLMFCFSVPITVFICYTLRLYLSCNESYKLLFSLMVYIHPKQKLHLLQVAQFFTDEKRHAFRFLNGTKATPSSCVSLIGWTVTCIALVCTIE